MDSATNMPTNHGGSGVSNWHVFKIRLNEYTCRVGLPKPVYETTEYGPSHEPLFRSQVTMDDITYKSLPGFFDRKTAEYSAAEVALVELAKCGAVEEEHIPEIVLYKKLQEYAQKMNYAIPPIYRCNKIVEPTVDEAGRLACFCCTVTIGGIRYIGGAARTRKQARIKAARTALLAIKKTEPESSGKPVGNSQFSVIPCKKWAIESANKPEETGSVPKAKKPRFMKNDTQIEGSSNSVIATGTHQEGSKGDQTNAHGVQVEGSAEATRSCQEGISDVEPIDGDINTWKGASNWHVFKIRLQEYTHRVGLPNPVYETMEYGTSREPLFRSQVTVNDITYNSLPGFFNRKTAEHSAAEVALVELAKCGAVEEELIRETGLCKILVKEYAQKMNYAIPIYQCKNVEATGNEAGRLTHFCCTVEIGGIRYTGGAARKKKEAEIKAARTALLAIQTTEPESFGKPIGNSQLSVIPCKKRATESANKLEETGSVPKAKKARFMKKMWKIFEDKTNDTQIEGSSNSVIATGTHQGGSKGDQTNAHGVQVEGSAQATRSCQ
ncbi:hypothetical protein LWI28_006474 [Acer negundo]|uniref:DRBM domain-containing protein n=1 Tax=Acer negundo TaxID=4023 RepID=A0AAD5JGU5_ACENE|nr:hypothetical protein LWI28_006474 [Acer negundo]